MAGDVEGGQGQHRLRNERKNGIEISVEITKSDVGEIGKAEEEMREGFKGRVGDGETATEMIGDGKKSLAD